MLDHLILILLAVWIELAIIMEQASNRIKLSRLEAHPPVIIIGTIIQCRV